MNCFKCKHYYLGHEYNLCKLFGFECFKPSKICIFINDDYTLTENGKKI